MADKDYSQLTSATTASDTDLLAIYPTGGPLKKMTWATFKAAVITALGSAYLTVSNNLSDLASASAARANLGLGTAAQLASSAFFQVANNLSEVANAATARMNLGAAASDAATITSGLTLSGSVKQNVQALGALDIDLTLGEYFTKTIAANSTFTFSNVVAGKAQTFHVALTIGSSAVPAWPGSVNWGATGMPAMGNGTHLLTFETNDGGTNWAASREGSLASLDTVATANIGSAVVTLAKMAAASVGTSQLVDANVTAAKLASGAAVTNIGYTPANKGGDTFTGNVQVVDGGGFIFSTRGFATGDGSTVTSVYMDVPNNSRFDYIWATGTLRWIVSGVRVLSMDSSGNIIAKGNITSNGTPI